MENGVWGGLISGKTGHVFISRLAIVEKAQDGGAKDRFNWWRPNWWLCDWSERLSGRDQGGAGNDASYNLRSLTFAVGCSRLAAAAVRVGGRQLEKSRKSRKRQTR